MGCGYTDRMAVLKDRRLFLECMRDVVGEFINNQNPLNASIEMDQVEDVKDRFIARKDKAEKNPFWRKASNGQKKEYARAVYASCVSNNLITIDPEEERVYISDDEGQKMLDNSYYWLVYWPKEFPLPSGTLAAVAQAVLTAALTSGAIWTFFLRG